MLFSIRHYRWLLAFFISFSVLVPNTHAASSRLSPEEQSWLDDHPVIRIAPDPDFPPIESFSTNGDYQGIAADYVSLLEKKLGINFEILKLPSWSDALKQAQLRNADVFSAAASTPEREEYMSFTTPHIELPGVILGRTEVDQSLKMKDLHGMKVAVVKNYVWQALITRDHPEIELVPVPDLLAGLKDVSFGRVDAMVANLAIATHYIEKAGITNLRVAGESGYYGRYAFGVRNDWPQLKSIIEKGLAEITPQEKKTILNKWVHIKQKSLLESRTFWTILLSSVTLILVVAILVWIWSLRRAVNLKTAELSESEQRYHTLYDSAYEAIFILDSNQVIDCNQAAASMFACKIDDLVKQSILLLSPLKQADGSNSNARLQEIIKTVLAGQSHLIEWRCRRLNGESFDAEMSLNTYKAGTQQYILAIVRDITERKQIERLKEEFISNVSHEIRTPLTSIRGSLSLITHGKLGEVPEEISTLIKVAYRNTKRLLHLVNDLLDLQKLGTGEIAYEMKALDVAKFLEHALSANIPYGEQHQVEIILTPVPGNLTIMADKNRLMQVMSNLLSNAVKFSKPNSVVEIHTKQLDGSLRISVLDHGKGIPIEFQPFIFDRFTQADASSTRGAGGTGLGLNITKIIVEQHDGHLAFNTLEGQGTEFYFELPLMEEENNATA